MARLRIAPIDLAITDVPDVTTTVCCNGSRNFTYWTPRPPNPATTESIRLYCCLNVDFKQIMPRWRTAPTILASAEWPDFTTSACFKTSPVHHKLYSQATKISRQIQTQLKQLDWIASVL